MPHRVVYHTEAEIELDRLYADISAKAGFRIAGEFVDGILTFIDALNTFPERGTVRESRIQGLRIIGYRRNISVAFAVRGDVVLILGVFARGKHIDDTVLRERDKQA